MSLETLRPILFLCLFILLFILERVAPNYQHRPTLGYSFNLLFLFLSFGFMRLVFPMGLAVLASKLPFQVWYLSQFDFIPQVIITLIVFDFGIYWQHRFFHTFNWLWKFHAIHHSDQTLDVSSGFRFHPGEIILSGGYKLLLILILGPSIEAFLIYEMALSSFSLFTHSNLKIPSSLERWLRLIFVTPQMHYPHHSPQDAMIRTNYGNLLSIWDRLFLTLNQQPNHQFGLKSLHGENLKKNLIYPFTR